MTMFASLAPSARQIVVRAGMLASESGQARLSDRFLLLALAEGETVGSPVKLGATADLIRAEIELRAPRSRDRELLATLGIDLDQVRRQARAAVGMRPDDPAAWRLRRSPLWPLRLTLSGPATTIVLDESGRKVIEVARWTSRRGHRSVVAREDLLWGVLADAASESVRILRRCRVDLRRLWADLQCWHQSTGATGSQV
jgi:hypothetical protein